MSISPCVTARASRRAIVGSSVAAAMLLPFARTGGSIAESSVPSSPALQGPSQELAAWKTWLLTAPDELRPPAPGAPAEEEIEEILGALESPSDAMSAAIRIWSATPATAAWTTAAQEAFAEFRMNAVRQARAMALLHAAMHDAAVAAWDAQVAYERPSPAATDERIVPAISADPGAPTYPSSAAGIAAAAAATLSYLLPDAAPGRFDDLAREAAMSTVWAGAAFPSDVKAGLTLGAAVGQRAVARGQGDGADAAFDPATMPSGPGIWSPTPPGFLDPQEPLGGTWQPWLMERNDQFRPSPPPDYGSPAWQAELAAVRELARTRTLAQQTEASWWRTGANLYDGTHELIARHGLTTPHAARVLAYQSVSMADATIAVWDAKYTWWTSRPIAEDPEIVTAFPTPPFPAYPSGYSAYIGAMSQMAGLFFPKAAEQLDDLCWRAMRASAWAGIHYPNDNETAMGMGRQVARLAATRALEEGAIPA